MSFTGRQAGIRDRRVRTTRRRSSWCTASACCDALERRRHPRRSPGFQGVDANGDITTLGRGGSDTTAVAVALRPERRRVRDLLRRGRRLHRRPAHAARAPRSSTRSSTTTTCWSSPAPAPACCRCAPSSSPANGTWSSIPVRRSPTPRAPMSRRLPDNGGSRHHRHRARHVRGQGHHSRRARHVGRGSQAVQRAGVQPGERRHDHPERVGGRASPTSASPARAPICRAPARPSSASCPTINARDLHRR